MTAPQINASSASFTRALVEPRAVNYQRYTARSSSASGFRFIIDCPPDQLLDASALIEYTVSFNAPADNGLGFTGQWEGGIAAPGTGFSTDDTGALLGPSSSPAQFLTAFRQAFSMAHAMHEVELNLNEEKILQYPSEHVAAMERFYSRPDEIDNICSMSGGELDSGNFAPRVLEEAVIESSPTDLDFDGALQANLGVQLGYEQSISGLVADPNTVNMRAGFPRYEDWYNPGLTRRWHKLARDSRYSDTAADADAANVAGESRYGGTTNTFKLTERLPFAPFVTWQTRDRQALLANLRRIDISVTWAHDAVSRFLQGNDTLNSLTDGTVTVDWFTVKPVMYLRWTVPPSMVNYPPIVSIPWVHYTSYKSPTFPVEIPADDVSSAMQTVTFKRRIGKWPHKIFIYAQPTAGELGLSSEHFLELVDVEMVVDGVQGKLLRFSSQQMFDLYVRNSPVSLARKFDYNEWRRFHCVLALTRGDIGWDNEAEDGRSITLTARVKSHWNFPTVGLVDSLNQDASRTYQLLMLGEYEYQMILDKTMCELVK